jgi:hypothetical protein
MLKDLLAFDGHDRPAQMPGNRLPQAVMAEGRMKTSRIC